MSRWRIKCLVMALLFQAPPVQPLSNSTTAILEKRGLQQDERYLFCPTGRRSRPNRYWIQDKYGDKFIEISYMSYSQQTYGNEKHPIIWAGSDGRQSEISALDLVTGRVIFTCVLQGIDKSGDWEAMSLGPCGSQSSKVCIYVGIIGNNPAQYCVDQNCVYGKDEVNVYKFEEPDLSGEDSRASVDVSTLVLDYHHEALPANRADAETLFVDWTGDDEGKPGDLYIVTKYPGYEDQQRVVKVPAWVHEHLKPNQKINFSPFPVGTPNGSQAWVGGDMTTDGTIIAIRDYWGVFFFPRPRTMTVGEALESEPCSFNALTDWEIRDEERYFETVAFSGRRYMSETHECTRPKKGCRVAISVYRLRYESRTAARSANLFPTRHLQYGT